ncbi:MAG: glycoside hydrolase family 97 protein [Armatimonadetes bacterium]|nr:glycoside hydrolase family 97 protein [Armatimonadota bacterium]
MNGPDSNSFIQTGSPDGRLKLTLHFPEPGESRSPEWSLSFDGKPLLEGCCLSLSVASRGDLLANAEVTRIQEFSHRETVPVLFGKCAKAVDAYRAVAIRMRSLDGGDIGLEFRCYDDAVAFRYEVFMLPGTKSIAVSSEETTFRPSGNPTAYAQYLQNFTTSHEVNHTVLPLKKLMGGRLLDTPLTLQRKDGICLSITEAALTRYAGMSLMRPVGDVDGDLVCRLSPRPDGNKVAGNLPLKTPWRVVLVGKNPGALLESNTLFCLNPPNAIGDTSWVKPGKMTWTWWNNYLFEHERGAPIFTTEVQKKHIDWCAKNGIDFHDVVADERDHPWYFNGQDGLFPAPNADVTRVRPELDLAAVSAYAKAKGVRLWTWVHQGALRGRGLDAVFARFAEMGWSGMMVDFFDRDDQDTVEFAERILRAAAKHRILIHFHGMYKPTGWQRTYPNLMNHEGSRNLEYMKWSDTCPPEHTLTVAFNRLVAGPMDYHLGGFRSVPRAEFKPQNVAPVLLGTRCFNLALYVCIDNPNPMVADYPMAYEGQKGFDFIQEVPTWWDETRVLKAEIGKLLVVARRKGPDWWIGGASAGKPRVVDVPLTFLTQRFYAITTWSDGTDAERNPNDLSASTVIVAGQKSLRIRCATDGGFVCRLRQH